jgi:type II secretion system (T2SS) protein E
MRREVETLSTIVRLTGAYSSVRTVQEVVEVMRAVIEMRAERCALVAMTVHFAPEKRRRRFYATSRQHEVSVERSLHYFLESIRPLVRCTDLVLLLHNTYYFILPGANRQGGRIVLERLWDALLWRVHNVSDFEILRPCQMSGGYSSFPDVCDELAQCVVAAREAQVAFGELERAQPVEEEEDLSGLARKLGVPYLSSLPRSLPARVRGLIDPCLAQELRCYPLGRARDVLTVAMSDPWDRQVLDRLSRETGLHIFPVLTPPQELQTVLEQFV